MSVDPYCYPGTNILRNRFNIEDPDALKATEARVAAIALFVLEQEPLQTPFNEDRLKATHRAIFGLIYPWAGNYRENVGMMTKRRDSGLVVTYGDSAYVPREMQRIFAELAAENHLRGLDRSTLAARLAYYYAEIDATHPFREGNSRTLRKFTADLASDAGYELDWEPSGATDTSINRLYNARDAAFTRGYRGALEELILENLHDL